MEITQNELFPKYRHIIGFLLCLGASVSYWATIAISPLLTQIAGDLKTDIATVGYLSTMTYLFTGIAMILSVYIIKSLGNKKTMISGFVLIVAGLFVFSIGQNMAVFLIGRAIAGFGCGIVGTCAISIIAEWFPQKEKLKIATTYNICCMIAGFLGVSTTVQLFHAFGDSWRNVFLLIMFANLAMAILMIFVGKDNTVYNEYIKRNAVIQTGKPKNALLIVLKRKDVWALTVVMILAMFAFNAMQTYLPSFLYLERQFDQETASLYASFIAIAGFPGTLAGGIAAHAIGRHKPIFILSGLLASIALAFVFSVSVPVIILICIIVFGFATSLKAPSSQTTLTEMKGGTPEIAAGAYSIVYGFGLIFTFFAPTLLSALSGTFGLSTAMLIFAAVMAASGLFGFFITETGRKRKNSSDSEKEIQTADLHL